MKEVITSTHTLPTAPITFSALASAELERLMHTLNISSEQGLRVGVKGGGCAGVAYLLAFDHEETGDAVYTANGLKILIKKTDLMHLVGLEIDYENTEGNKGFTFSTGDSVSKL